MIGSAIKGSAGQKHAAEGSSSPPLHSRPADQKPHQHLLIVFIDAHAMIVDGRFEKNLCAASR